jgi:hypothetical protein
MRVLDPPLAPSVPCFDAIPQHFGLLMGGHQTSNLAARPVVIPAVQWSVWAKKQNCFQSIFSSQLQYTLTPCGLLVSFPCLESAVQRGSGYLEGTANFRNRVCGVIIEGLGNTELSAGKGVGSPACPSSCSCCGQTGCCSFPNEVSLKLRKRAEDMEDEFSATGGGIYECQPKMAPPRRPKVGPPSFMN